MTVFNNSAPSSGLSAVEIVLHIASIQLIMHTVRSGPGTPGWRCVHSVASFVVLLIQLDRFGCPNRKQRISYSLKVLEDRCLKADLNMSSSVFWGEEPLSDLPVHIPACLSSRAQVLQKLAEGCLSLSKKQKDGTEMCFTAFCASVGMAPSCGY